MNLVVWVVVLVMIILQLVAEHRVSLLYRREHRYRRISVS